MSLFTKFTGTVSLAAILSVTLTTSALSQEVEAQGISPEIVTESFDGEDDSLMLGGQIFFDPPKSPWVIYVASGDLVMENRGNPKSLHYNDIAWVKFPNADSVESTEDLTISAVVESQNEGMGGAGILVGSGKSGKYLAFVVDAQGRFHVLKKDGRQLRAVHSAKHEAVTTDGPNRLSFQVRGAHVLFFVNEKKVIQVPFSKRSTNSRNSEGGTGIGIAALGVGEFRFEEVEISRSN